MATVTKLALDLTEQSLLPDCLIRVGIRRLVRQRLQALNIHNCEERDRIIAGFVANMHAAPVAPVPEKANEQHYEVPAEFFARVLGIHRKYSSCYWPEGVTGLDEAEAESLRLTCEHAGLENGQTVLELGCGWGSLSLWMAARYPGSRFTAVSNSHSQRRYIESVAGLRNLQNLRVLTADMNRFQADGCFDRVVSVEMFEHMRNYAELYRRIYGWLKPGGRFFKHIFCHRDTPYEFTAQDDRDWMSRYFFSGGIMPSDELPLNFQSHLNLVRRWRWNGTHYARTAEAWLQNMDNNRAAIWPVLEEVYGVDQVGIWWERWRVFFMACAELFGYDNGQQWWVSHYLFERPQEQAA